MCSIIPIFLTITEYAICIFLSRFTRTPLQHKKLHLSRLSQLLIRLSRKSSPFTSLFFQKWSRFTYFVVSERPSNYALYLHRNNDSQCSKNLPIPDEMKSSRGAESPIRVVDLVFSSGESRKWEMIKIIGTFPHEGLFLLRSVQTIAFNLPNDERVRKEKGAKKVRGVINVVARILFCQHCH